LGARVDACARGSMVLTPSGSVNEMKKPPAPLSVIAGTGVPTPASGATGPHGDTEQSGRTPGVARIGSGNQPRSSGSRRDPVLHGIVLRVIKVPTRSW